MTPAVVNRINQIFPNSNSEDVSKNVLITTIKVSKNILALKDHLPDPNYDQDNNKRRIETKVKQTTLPAIKKKNLADNADGDEKFASHSKGKLKRYREHNGSVKPKKEGKKIITGDDYLDQLIYKHNPIIRSNYSSPKKISTLGAEPVVQQKYL